MSNNLHSVQRSLSAPMLFSVLPENVRASLREGATLKRFGHGQVIWLRGDAPDGFWLIESGSVAVGQFLPDGDFRGFALLGPGDSLGELAMFSARPRAVDAIARDACAARHIPQALFDKALGDDPAALRPLLGALSQQLQETLDIVASIRRGSAAARLAGLLLTLAGHGSARARLDISQQELGELLGLTRVTVNKVLREFEAGGLLRRSYGSVEIVNADALRLLSLE